MPDTPRNGERRSLRFESIAECLDEVERIAAAADANSLRTVGNWSPGQIMSHVANWIDYGYEGFPPGRPPFFIRWFLQWSLRGILNKGMSAGVKIPGVPGGTHGAEDMDAAAAAEKLRSAFERLESNRNPQFDSPAFGKMSHDDRIKLNLRHAELHLSFLNYD